MMYCAIPLPVEIFASAGLVPVGASPTEICCGGERQLRSMFQDGITPFWNHPASSEIAMDLHKPLVTERSKLSGSSTEGNPERLAAIHNLGRRHWLLLGLAVSSGCAAGKSLWKSGGNPVIGQIDADAPADFTTTPSGLRYKVMRKSDGKRPKRTDKVSVHYKGWLDNGKVFDSSYDRGSPTSFGVQEVIPGWTEGLMLIGEGGMIELEIPSELGYGARGAGRDIPPHSTLHFQVELVKVH